jgi:PAS domain S-box-containing protein
MSALSPDEIAHRLRMLIDQTEELVVLLTDPRGTVQWCNPGAAHILGIPGEKLAGQPLEVLFTPEDRERGLAEHEREVAAVEGHGEDDRWHLRGDGSRFWAAGMLTALRTAGGELVGFGKVLRNRTDQREYIDTVRNAHAAAEAGSRRKDVFLSTLSHELRGPLAPLRNALSILHGTTTGREPPEHGYALKVIERQMAHLQRLVDDLLDTSRIAEGKIVIQRERLALQQILREVFEDSQSGAQERGVRLELIVPEGGPLSVEGDRARLRQVFANLTHNALKFTPAGGRVVLKATAEGDEVVARVQDNGVGIPTGMQPRIFELFTQVENAYSGGLGIGLALVKELVTLHGGSVQVLSEGPGKGSEFAVRLPLVD